MGQGATELWERLQSATGWDGRWAACDDVLGRVVGMFDPVARELAAAWHILVGSGGTSSVADLAREVGWSRQHLTVRFRDEFGLSPKLAARVVRFERARLMLQRARHPRTAEVAVACGYYDQPHLHRDFLELAGCPPAEWLAAELPSFQDGGAPDGAQ